MFSRSVQALGRTGDILPGLNISCHSPNVLRAAEAARAARMAVLALTGKNSRPLTTLAKVEFRVPHGAAPTTSRKSTSR